MKLAWLHKRCTVPFNADKYWYRLAKTGVVQYHMFHLDKTIDAILYIVSMVYRTKIGIPKTFTPQIKGKRAIYLSLGIIMILLWGAIDDSQPKEWSSVKT